MLRRHWLVGIFCASLGVSIGCQGNFETTPVNDDNAASNQPGSPSLRAYRFGIYGHRLTGAGGQSGGTSGSTGGSATGGTTVVQSGGTSGTPTGGTTVVQSGGTSGTPTGGSATGGTTVVQSGGTSGTPTGGSATGGTTAPPGSGGSSGGASGTCGNGRLDPGELCDGSAMQSATCAQLGFPGGSLGCSASCQFDVSSCTGGTITPTVVASRTSCAAPCSVFFDATSTKGLAGGAGGSGGIAGGDYVQANWNWDFNDPKSPHRGTIGFIAAHVFDNPGTYRVSTRVRDIAGNAGSTTTTITVSAMTGTTYYVANSGNDANNGTSTSSAFQTLAHALTFAGTNKSILLRRGDTFNIGSSDTTMAVAGPFLLGSYSDPGAPSAVAPILSSTDTGSYSSVFNLSGGSDMRFTDLHVVGGGAFTIFNITGAPTSLFERVEVEKYTQTAGGNGWVLGAPFISNLSIVDCHAHDFVGYGLYADRSVNLALIGTTIENFSHDHAFRLQGGSSNGGTVGQFTNNSYVAENTITVPVGNTFSAGGLFRGENTNSVYVNNTNTRNVAWLPQDNTFVEHVSLGLAEGNKWARSDFDPNMACISIVAQNIVVRNNLCTKAVKLGTVGAGTNLPVNWTDRIFFFNNTFYQPDSFSYAAQIGQVTGTTGTVTYRNNIEWTASNSNGSAIYQTDGKAGQTNISDHNALYAPNTGSLSAPNVGTGGVLADPKFVANGSDFHLQSGSPARNTATSVPIYEDLSAVTRAKESDMGAYEYNP